MIFYVIAVTFLITLFMDKFTYIVMNNWNLNEIHANNWNKVESIPNRVINVTNANFSSIS